MAHDKILSRIRAMRGTDVHTKIEEICNSPETPPQARNRFRAIKAIMDDQSLGYADLSKMLSASIPVIYHWAKLFLTEGTAGLMGKQSGWSGKMVTISDSAMQEALDEFQEEPIENARLVGQVLTKDTGSTIWAPYGWICNSRISFDKTSVYGTMQPLKTASQVAFDCDRAQRLTIDLPFLEYKLKAWVVDLTDPAHPRIIRSIKTRSS
jgi:transposase